MLDIGVQELLVLMIIALVIFGPDKLPELGRRFGRALREFRRASDEFRSTIETNLKLNEDTILPPSATLAPAPASAAGSSASGALGAETVGTDAAGAPAAPSEPADAPRGLTPETIPLFEEGDGTLVREPFWTVRGGRLLHRSSCGWAARVAEPERIPLKTAAEGIELGLRTCPVCDPQDAVPVS